MTEYINKTHDPGADGQNYGIPPNDGELYQWQRILAGGGTSEFAEIRMRGPIYDKNGVEILGGGGGGGIPNNFTAVVDPTPNDDSTLTYQVGSEWLNTVTGLFFKAESVAPGAAVWVHDTAQTSTNQNLVFNGGTVTPGTVRGILMTPTGVGTIAGIDSIAIGANCDATGAGTAIAIGASTVANQGDTIAIGINAQATAQNAVAIGQNAESSAPNSVALGNNCKALGSDSLAIGDGALVFSGTSASTAVGFTAYALANHCVSIGHGSAAYADNSIAVGRSAQVNNVASTNSICIGDGCQVNNAADVILIGQNSTCIGSDSVVVGHDSTSNFAHTVAIGDNVLVNQAGGVAIGSGAQVLAAPNPLLAFGFGTAPDPVVPGTQFDRFPVRIAGVNRNILLRNTDLALDDLTDVAITSAIAGDILNYNGTNWINTSVPYAPTTWPTNIISNAIFASTGQTWTYINVFIPQTTTYFRYLRIWLTTTATSTSSYRAAIYNGTPAAGGAIKCYTNVKTPAINLNTEVVLDLTENVVSNLIFNAYTQYSLAICCNNPTATNLRILSIAAGQAANTFGTGGIYDMLTTAPATWATCPSLAARTERIGFQLSNNP